MTPTPTTTQRKQGVSLLKPLSWNHGRRFTSPGPAGRQTENVNNVGALFSAEVSPGDKLGESAWLPSPLQISIMFARKINTPDLGLDEQLLRSWSRSWTHPDLIKWAMMWELALVGWVELWAHHYTGISSQPNQPVLVTENNDGW